MSPMFRSLVSATLAAAALACAGTAQAQNAVIYGLLDASVSRARPPGGDFQYRLDSGNMALSFLGIRGREDLGGGLNAVYKLEAYVGLDTGTVGRFNGDTFYGRDSNVGLQGAFGTTVFGRSVTPLYLATVNFNPFGESFGFSPSTRQYFAGAVLGDRSWSNSVSYSNNASDSPLRIAFAANAPEQGPGSLSTGRNVGGSLAYISGPFAATLALEQIKNSTLPLPVGFNRQVAMQAGATYDFKVVRLYGQAGRVRTDAEFQTKTVLYQLGAAVPVGNSLVMLAFGRSQARTPFSQITDRIGSVGYDYFLSKNTDIYVAASYEKTYQLSTGSSVAGGMRLRF